MKSAEDSSICIFAYCWVASDSSEENSTKIKTDVGLSSSWCLFSRENAKAISSEDEFTSNGYDWLVRWICCSSIELTTVVQVVVDVLIFDIFPETAIEFLSILGCSKCFFPLMVLENISWVLSIKNVMGRVELIIPVEIDAMSVGEVIGMATGGSAFVAWYSQFSIDENEYRSLLSEVVATGLLPAEKIPASDI